MDLQSALHLEPSAVRGAGSRCAESRPRGLRDRSAAKQGRDVLRASGRGHHPDQLRSEEHPDDQHTALDERHEHAQRDHLVLRRRRLSHLPRKPVGASRDDDPGRQARQHPQAPQTRHRPRSSSRQRLLRRRGQLRPDRHRVPRRHDLRGDRVTPNWTMC